MFWEVNDRLQENYKGFVEELQGVCRRITKGL